MATFEKVHTNRNKPHSREQIINLETANVRLIHENSEGPESVKWAGRPERAASVTTPDENSGSKTDTISKRKRNTLRRYFRPPSPSCPGLEMQELSLQNGERMRPQLPKTKSMVSEHPSHSQFRAPADSYEHMSSHGPHPKVTDQSVPTDGPVQPKQLSAAEPWHETKEATCDKIHSDTRCNLPTPLDGETCSANRPLTPKPANLCNPPGNKVCHRKGIPRRGSMDSLGGDVDESCF